MQQVSRSIVDFEVTDTAGDARRGKLTVGDTVLETPNMLPVVNFYAGGTENSLYGGGIHRTMKEFMMGADVIGGGDYSEYFDCAMTSVASLTDYGISRERFEDYIAAPIRERDVFEGFTGSLFIDSGGFKFLGNSGLDGSDFEVEIDQRTAYDIQQRLGGDIVVNLDYPIAPDDSYEERVTKARRTAANIFEFLELSADDDCARYLTLHGYNYSMIGTFLETITETVSRDRLHAEFDGIALGGLVPIKDNKGKLITAVQDCRTVLDDWGFDDLPLHVLGISSGAIPLLSAVGADTFDSSSYLQSAINGKYNTSVLNSVHIDDVDFSECDCPVCSTPMLVKQMKGNAEYTKDRLGNVAMHNLIIQKEAVKRLREAIREPGTDGIIDYIETTIGSDKLYRQFGHRVVNESLGGYF